VNVTLLLADSAQEVGGKLYILGGGWSLTGPEVGPMALAIKIDVPWSAANQKHTIEIKLLSEDGAPPPMKTEDGIAPGEARFGGSFEVGRPPGLPPGTDLDTVLAIQLGPLPLVPGHGYVWQVEINGHMEEHWRQPFRVRPALDHG
jgi:hypothetical protein